MNEEFIAMYDFLTIAEIPMFSLSCNYALALGTFLNEFYECNSSDKILALQDEPIIGILDRVQYCKLAAAAHKLSVDYDLPIPDWTFKSKYTMPYPIYAYNSDDTDFHELLKDITPNEYKIRNLFVGSKILKRV